MQTMAWRDALSTVVLVHGESEPTDAEWEEYVAALARRGAEGRTLRVLVVTPGAGPNMRQRKQLNDGIGRIPIRTAVVTSSGVGRAVVTLIGLRFPEIRAFEPNRLDLALQHLEVASSERDGVVRTVEQLQRLLKS